ncbi:ATP-binding protein [Actinacidiphila bryophytorum]|uniref:AAA ATPase domain-containing protein n=1 Tax=Actinacidiphila bryophytorum TaxID=1436133 RepID=A0A9W4ED11_9ACTN|nr:AAA family ATPase [Actinacidiphila bryophytorum]MBM9439257.1 AAA family ATPase [Actinacidiphila bryophytorum]MBN6543055.1 AAA family ATPase [Actinacidiphila bryophytorum]CAG7619853.1 AAA ATPase domain-containing protein [Actinacidiphila bryophytorum]
MPQRQTRNRRALLEREAELLAVDDALGDVSGRLPDGTGIPGARRRGGLLAFAGSAGLGKTTLLAEVRRRAADHGCTVLSARGGDQEQQVAFHVARQLLQPQLAGAAEAEIRATLGSWYGIVGPALGLCAAEGTAPDPQGIRDGLDWVLTHLAVQRAPAVLVLDDAHWADPQSLNWLAAFAPRADDLALLIVVAYRPDELPAGAEAFRGLPGRAGHRPLGLEPLTADAVGRLVRDEVGEHADDAFCRECWAVTAGNPFEAVELTAKLRDRGVTPDGSSTHLLRDLAAATKGRGLVSRLERLGPSTVRLAWSAAVLGTQVPPDLAADVAGLGREEAADCAERLRQARILTSSRTLEFAHPLIATAVYHAIPDAMRVALHGQAAQSVVDAGLGASAAARHLLETHPEGDPWVVGRLRAAARETLRAGAPETARSYLGRALREPPQDEDRAAVLYELGCASQLLEPSVTVNHLRAALEEPISDPALRDGIVFKLSQSLAHSDRLSEAAEVVAQAARTATSARTRLRMQSEQFMWDAFRADEADSPGRSRRLTRLADRLTGRDLTERYIIGLRAWDATLRGEHTSTVLRHAGRALEGGLPWADEDRGFEVPVLVAMTYAYADRPERAEELFAAGIADFERHGWRGAHLSFGLLLLGYVRYRQGRLADAEDLARDGLRLAERVGRGTPVQWYAVAVLTDVLLARGRVAEATALAAEYAFREPFPAAVTFPDAQAVHGELLLARGLHQQAADELAAVGRRLDARGMRNPAWCPWQLHLALAESRDAPRQARDTVLDAVARARQYGARSAIGHALLVAAEVCGGPERLTLLTEAVDLLAASPAEHLLAQALVARGAALREDGRIEQAAELLDRGLETALRCAADGTAAQARTEIARCGVRPAAPGAAAT